MQAAVITVGSELTAGIVRDDNQAWISRQLENNGLPTAFCISVPDSMEAIGEALGYTLGTAPALVVMTGGLGPTSDDLTAEAIAEALSLELAYDPLAVKMVAEATGSSADALEPLQKKQAELPAGSMVIKPAGTAPGFVLATGEAPVVVLPGVPWEMRRMWPSVMENEAVRTVLAGVRPNGRIAMCFYGSGEPQVSRAVDDLFAGLGEEVKISICARRREVVVDATFPLKLLDDVERSFEGLRHALKSWYYSDGKEIEEVIAAELTRLGKTLAVGESCTGGLLGAAITGISGSSRFFRGGVTAYDNEIKKGLLGVRQEALDKAGAVSEPVSQQLALGARARLDAEYGVGVTGIAGPTGGTKEKPVGLVFICVSSPEGDVVERFDFPGGRENVRAYAVTAALHMLYQKVLNDHDTADES